MLLEAWRDFEAQCSDFRCVGCMHVPHRVEVFVSSWFPLDVMVKLAATTSSKRMLLHSDCALRQARALAELCIILSCCCSAGAVMRRRLQTLRHNCASN
jgi:hypothetical protein